MNDAPLAPDAFVGRDHELDALDGLLVDGARIVSLIGMGGTGKTRLALEFAKRCGRTTWFVDLSACQGPADLTRTVAAPGSPFSSVAGDADIGPALATSEVDLLILDGFERVAPFARHALRHWVAEAPETCFLVTSRVPLEVRGEHRILLAPLACDHAHALLVHRVREIDFRFDPKAHTGPLAAIVERLEGLPLAIELAAARLQTLSPEQLLRRLSDRLAVLRSPRRDCPERHTALAATLDDAWQQLAEEDQIALAECAVFPGAFCIDAAEAVVTASPEGPALDRIERLVSCGLLRVLMAPGDERRLQLLDVVATYARHRAPDPGAAAEDRHARHYRARVRALLTPEGFARRILVGVPEPLLREVHHLEAIVHRSTAPDTARFDAGLALLYLLGDTGPPAPLLRALSVLEDLATDDHRRARVCFARFWAARFEGVAHPTEADLREAYGAMESDDWSALLAYAMASHLERHGRMTASFDWYQRAVDHAERSGKPTLRAMCHEGPTTYLSRTGRVGDVRVAVDRLLEMGRDLDLTRLQRVWLNHRSSVLFELGHIDEAIADFVEVERLAAGQGGPVSVSAVVNCIEYLYAAGRADEAATTLERAREMQAKSGKRLGALADLARAEAWMALAEGDPDRAEAALQDPDRHRRMGRTMLGHSVALAGRGMADLLRDHDAAALDHFDRAIPLEAELHETRTDLSIVLMLRALAHARLGRPAAAREDRTVGEREAARWGSARIDAVVAMIGHAIAVRLQEDDGAAEEAAHAALSAFGDGQPRYAELRLAARLVEAELAAGRGPDGLLRVGPQLSWVQVGGTHIDLVRKPVRRSLLGALVQARLDTPDRPVPTATLIAQGWPGDRSTAKALENRLWVTLSKLRRSGLASIIERTDGGYLIPGRVAVRVTPEG